MTSKTMMAIVFILAVCGLVGLMALIQNSKNSTASSTPPAASSAVIEVTVDNFQQEVLQSNLPVYVLFYTAQGCEPCKQQLPVVDKIAPEYVGKVKFVRIDAVKQQQISRAAGIQAVPAHFLVNNGTAYFGEGFADEATLKKFIEDGLQATAGGGGGGQGNGNGGNGNQGAAPNPFAGAINR